MDDSGLWETGDRLGDLYFYFRGGGTSCRCSKTSVS